MSSSSETPESPPAAFLGFEVVSLDDHTATMPIGELPLIPGGAVKLFFAENVYWDIVKQARRAAPAEQQRRYHKETGGILVGSFRRTFQGDYFVFVDGCEPMEDGTLTTFSISRQQFATALPQMRARWPGMLVVGIYHSHPGHGVYHSELDRRALGKEGGVLVEPWQFSLVIDPLLRSAKFPQGAVGIFFDNVERGRFGIDEPFPMD